MSQEEFKVYKGNCHCGAFRFEINVSQIEKVDSCNCGICLKKGYLWVFLPNKHFRVTKGKEDELTTYEFGSKTMPHKFCPVCGTGVILRKINAPEEHEEVYVNVRSLLEINPFDLKINRFDGKSMYPGGDAPSFTGDLPSTNSQLADAMIYTGGCHCGAVTLAFRSSPLSKVQVKEDNCSICRRNANVCIYPNKSQVSISGAENTTEYLFGQKFNGHCFCRTCGVQLFMRLHGPPKQLVVTWPETRQKMVKEKLEIIPIRVAVLDNVDWDELTIERSDEGTEGYEIA